MVVNGLWAGFQYTSDKDVDKVVVLTCKMWEFSDKAQYDVLSMD